ncbi:MAG: pyridoxal-phosphate-dependent aminotransferase family protein [Vulcanimicrobiaceae bacterium]
MKKTLLLLPGPVPVAQPVLEAMAWPMINHRGPEFAELQGRLERDMRPIFGTQREVVFLGCSGTGGLEAAVASTFSPGDYLLSCPVGVFGKRLAAIATSFGCTVEMLETPLGSALDPQALAARLEADTGRRIAGVLLTHNETSTGVQNDMSAYVPALREHGAITIVDSVSGLGASHFAMDSWGYDVVVSASQKALAVPPGVAMVAVSERGWSAMERARGARFYFDLLKAREFARNGQTPWTPPISVFYALAVSLSRYHSAGVESHFARHATYARAIRTALEALGFTSFSEPNAHSVTVVAATPPAGVQASALLTKLREGYGLVISGGQGELSGKIVRVGTMGDIDTGDVLGAIASIECAMADIGVSVELGSGVAAASAELREGMAATV